MLPCNRGATCRAVTVHPLILLVQLAEAGERDPAASGAWHPCCCSLMIRRRKRTAVFLSVLLLDRWMMRPL
jgi:hypothetical protein